jgi:hypothetical protein
MSEYEELKQKFHDKVADLYPGVKYPEVCWLFDVALNIDPRTVVEAPISKKSYKVMILDENGKRVSHNDQVLSVTRKFSPKQAKIVREWWPLIPEGIKV